jgi:pilus assembly protein CpaE
VSGPPIRTLVLLGEGVPRKTVERALGDTAGISLADVVEGVDKSWRVPAGGLFDVLVLACSNSSEGTLEVIESVVKKRPELPLIVLHVEGAEENGFMERVFQAGADDIVTLPEKPERVLETLRKAVARRRGSAATTEAVLAPLISIVGPKGGTGKTVTTCNLAAALAEEGHRVVVVDLDLNFGDIALGLRIMPERTIYDLALVGDSLDAEKIEGFLATHSSGARVLPAPIRPEQAGSISAEFLARVFAILRATHDYVIVDTPSGFPPEVISAIDNSTDICMVGMLDAFSLKDTKLGLETLSLMSYHGRVSIVLNRADSHVGITAEDVTAILGRAPDILVPSERQIPRSINEGVPIVLAQKRSPASRAFRQLAQLYLADAYGARDNGRPARGRGLRRRKG